MEINFIPEYSRKHIEIVKILIHNGKNKISQNFTVTNLKIKIKLVKLITIF